MQPFAAAATPLRQPLAPANVASVRLVNPSWHPWPNWEGLWAGLAALAVPNRKGEFCPTQIHPEYEPLLRNPNFAKFALYRLVPRKPTRRQVAVWPRSYRTGSAKKKKSEGKHERGLRYAFLNRFGIGADPGLRRHPVCLVE